MRKSEVSLGSECAPEEIALLKRVLSENNYSGRHMEIGTAAGGTLKELIGVYMSRGTCPEFVVIDTMTYFERQYEVVCQNLCNAGIDPSSVSFWIGTTHDFLSRERLQRREFDFIFIDAQHRHVPVTADLQWADLVRENGTICLHDYSGHFPGVIWAIDRFLAKNPNFKVLDRVGSMIALKKLGKGRTPTVTSYDMRAARFAQWCFRRKRQFLRIGEKFF